MYFQIVKLFYQCCLIEGKFALEFAYLLFDYGKCKFDDWCAFLGLTIKIFDHTGHHTQSRWFKILHIDRFGQIDNNNDCSDSMDQQFLPLMLNLPQLLLFLASLDNTLNLTSFFRMRQHIVSQLLQLSIIISCSQKELLVRVFGLYNLKLSLHFMILFTFIQNMDIINQIGHVQHWGLSPATNLLKFQSQQPKTHTYRILMSGCSDIRHILKTFCDINQKQLQTGKKLYERIQIYFHQPNKQLLCRCLLFLHIIHETNLNFEERIQIFLDLYGNAMIKQRNAKYLHNLREDLLDFIHAQKKIVTCLKNFVNLKLLKFQDRDEMSEFIQSWSNKIPFQIEKLRDQKLRYHFKQRYDYRNNLIDWDYNMMLIECAPIVHFYHYKEWRLSGLAFEQRFSKYNEPNRTLASYVDGKKKGDKTSCLVRGYWGDIMVSPYIALGTKCDYKQAELLYKKANYKYIGHAVEIAEYNMTYWLTMLQERKEYSKLFRDYYRCDEETKKILQQKTEQKKKRKAINQIKQTDEEHEEDIEQPEELKQQSPSRLVPTKPKNQQGLDSDEEQQKKKVQIINSKQINYEKQEKELLKGFANYGMFMNLMAMNGQKLMQGKYSQYFDMVVLGFIHSAYLNKGVHSIVKKGGILLTQKATYLIPKKKQQRKQLNTKLQELVQKDKAFKQIIKDDDFLVYRRE